MLDHLPRQNPLHWIEPAPSQPTTMGAIKLAVPSQPVTKFLQGAAMFHMRPTLPQNAMTRGQFKDFPAFAR
jgi:hypothetical protein